MSFAKAAHLLRQSLKLCEQALDGETDPDAVASLDFVLEQLAEAISLLEQHGDGPAFRADPVRRRAGDPPPVVRTANLGTWHRQSGRIAGAA